MHGAKSGKTFVLSFDPHIILKISLTFAVQTARTYGKNASHFVRSMAQLQAAIPRYNPRLQWARRSLLNHVPIICAQARIPTLQDHLHCQTELKTLLCDVPLMLSRKCSTSE
jgi:hypothetical protein